MADDIVVPRKHYDVLIAAANGLVTVADNAVATILEGTPYESMLRGPSEALKSALADVPGAVIWDGTWREEDVEYDVYRHHSQPDRSGPNAAIKATHRPTGLSIESYAKPSADANKASARKGLMARVERYGRQQGLL